MAGPRSASAHKILAIQSLLSSIGSGPHADCRRTAVFRLALCRFKGSKFHPKVACMPLVDQRKELVVGCSQRGDKKPLRKQNRIRQSPTPVPSCTDNTPYLTLHNITYSLILNFVPTAPVCPHVASLPIQFRRSDSRNWG